MKNETVKAIEELQKRIEGLTDPDEIAECIEDYKSEIKGERKDLNTLDWDEIAELISNPTKKKLFKLGAVKNEELYTGEKVEVRLMSLNPHDTLAGSNKKANAMFMFLVDGEYEMNETPTNSGGWEKSKMRTQYMQRFFKLLPEKLQNAIKAVTKTTCDSNGNIQKTTDKLFILSEVEATGQTTYSGAGEGEQYEYLKKNRLPEEWLWLRSPSVITSNSFCFWNFNGYVAINTANAASRVALCFCL